MRLVFLQLAEVLDIEGSQSIEGKNNASYHDAESGRYFGRISHKQGMHSSIMACGSNFDSEDQTCGCN